MNIKILIPFLLFQITILQAAAQQYINSSFIQTSIGRSIKLTYEKEIKTFALEAGLKTLIRFVPEYEGNTTFKNSFNPDSPEDYLGLYLSARKYFLFRNSSIRPFVFYNFQYSNSSVRPIFILPASSDPVTYKKINENFQRTKAFEQFIGVGFKCKIVGSLYMEQKVATGAVIFRNVDPRLVGSKIGQAWEVEFLMYSFGLSYAL